MLIQDFQDFLLCWFYRNTLYQRYSKLADIVSKLFDNYDLNYDDKTYTVLTATGLSSCQRKLVSFGQRDNCSVQRASRQGEREKLISASNQDERNARDVTT